MAETITTPPTFADVADALVAQGYCPVPIVRGQKRPAVEGWLTYAHEDWMTALKGPPVSWLKSHGNCWTGVRLGVNQLWCLDIDIYDRALALKAWGVIAKVLGRDSLVRFGARPKFAVLFRCDSTASRKATPRYNTTSHLSAVEALGAGRQVVVFGMHPDTGKPYDWPKQSPRDVAVEKLPFVPEAELESLLAQLTLLFEQEGYEPVGATWEAGEGQPSKLGPKAGRALLEEALGVIPNDAEGLHYDDWIRAGLAIKAALGEEGRDLFEAFSYRSAKYSPERTARAWDSFQPRGEIGAGSLFAMAREQGWPLEEARARQALEAAGEFETPPEPESEALADAQSTGALLRRWLTETPPPTEWLVDDLIPANIAGLVVAAGGTGKSQLFLQLGMALAAGQPWLEFPVKRPRRVIYLAAEDAELFIWQRIHFIAQWWRTEATLIADFDQAPVEDPLTARMLDELEKNLVVVPADRMRGVPRLTHKASGNVEVDAKGIARMLKFLRPLDPDLVCIDPAIRFMSGDENSSMDAARFVEAVEVLKTQLGCTVLVAHHKGKATGRAEGEGAEQSQYGARGSSALVDNSRWVADLSRLTMKAAGQLYDDLDPEGVEDGRYIRWRVVKSNYAALGGERLLMRIDGSPVLVPVTSSRRADRQPLELPEIADKIVARLLEIDPPPTVRMFVEQHKGKAPGRLGVSRDMLIAAIDYGLTAGLLEEYQLPGDRATMRRIRVRGG